MMKTIKLPGVPLSKIDDVTRREFLVGAAGLLLLPAGCGISGESGGETSGETRTVEHALGTTEVPVSPERTVALVTATELDGLLTLGVDLVASAADTDEDDGLIWPPYLKERFAERLENVEMLPRLTQEISLERVAGLQPDLILGTAFDLEEIYGELSQIAPTVGVEADWEQGWKGVLRDLAGVFGEEELAERIISDFDGRVEVLSERHRAALGGVTYTAMYSFAKSESEFYLPGTPNADQVLEKLGMQRPPEQEREMGETGDAFLSLERLDLVDTDVVLIYKYPGEEAQREINKLKASPLFQKLKAVENGLVFEVNPYFWLFAGPTAMTLMLDDLEDEIIPALMKGAG
jgi:iron complex transport system substrate-binding protein